MYSVRAEAMCAGVPATESFGMTRCIRQGGIESPWTFNLVVKTVLAKNKVRLDECGIQMPTLGSVTVIGWANKSALHDPHRGPGSEGSEQIHPGPS